MRINLAYLHETKMGYARYGTKLAAALSKAGVSVEPEISRLVKDPAPVACWVSVPVHARGWFKGQRLVMNTMWETHSLPEGFRENMDAFDQIIVPSEQNVELFSRYHNNVAYVPLGVDTHEWAFRERIQPERRFVFMTSGGGSRKGSDLTHAAFQRLWGKDGSWPAGMPEPTLVLKSPKGVDLWGKRVEHINGYLSDQDEVDLYAMANCYVGASRGEGFGMMPLQAIAQGCPTILTDAHGHKAFSHLGYGIPTVNSKADYFMHGPAGDWWEPDLDTLCELMEYVYYNYGQAVEFAKMASAQAHRWFTWERCAEQFIAAIGKHNLNKEYRGDGSWFRPESKKYLVRVLKPWRAEVAGTVFQFQPGVDYYEIADIKRIMFELEVLDPSCIVSNPTGEVTELETGMSAVQLARLGDYSASMGHCWDCGQKLNVPGMKYEPVFEDDNAG